MNPKVWGIIAAAGRGSRFGDSLPKQYQKIAGKTVIEWAIGALSSEPVIEGIVVALAANDQRFARLQSPVDNLVTVTGGATRAASVSSALHALEHELAADDWVLIHDAARPCLTQTDIKHLIETLHAEPVGGLLACPLADTVKQADDSRHVIQTLQRKHLWRALTPQMFRFGLLTQALRQCVDATDEAGAMEQAGHRVRLVQGRSDNIKITTPDDLKLAQSIIQRRRTAGTE